MVKKNQKGFTLIELLIVIAIIGLLAALALVSLTAAQQRARDTKRVADMKSFQTSLELYYNENAAYPVLASSATNTWAEMAEVMKPYISSLSTPPSDNAADDYFYITNNSDQYYIGSTLENTDHQVLTQDTDNNNDSDGDGTDDSVGGTGWMSLASDDTFNGTNATKDCADPNYCLGGTSSQ